jgi:hypothetical protein
LGPRNERSPASPDAAVECSEWRNTADSGSPLSDSPVDAS